MFPDAIAAPIPRQARIRQTANAVKSPGSAQRGRAAEDQNAADKDGLASPPIGQTACDDGAKAHGQEAHGNHEGDAATDGNAPALDERRKHMGDDRDVHAIAEQNQRDQAEVDPVPGSQRSESEPWADRAGSFLMLKARSLI